MPSLYPRSRSRRNRYPLGQTEIQHLHIAIEANHDVGRLQIAMNDARAMRGAKRLQHLTGDLDSPFHGGSAFEPVAQGFAFH